METLPGTGMLCDHLDPEAADRMLSGLFAGGGLVLSQVASLAGLELYSVQNWVRRGFVSPPVNKRYTRRQVCRLILIGMLKDSLEISEITGILSYINGDLAYEGDDTVSDDALYLYFVALLCAMEEDGADLDACIARVLEAYTEPMAGAKQRLGQVLSVFYHAYRASLWKKKAGALAAAVLADH